MKGYSYKIQGNQLIITVDLNSNLGQSQSGKSTLIASSYGKDVIAHKGQVINLNINVYKPNR